MRLQSFFAALGRAIDLVAECAGMSESDLLALGAAPADAAELLALHHSYFGPTHSTKKQRTAVAAARSRGHGLVTLRQIESFVAKVRDHNKAWDLRVELCQTSAELVEKVARKRLREWRKPREYAERAKLTQHGNGLATLTVTADSMQLTDVFQGIDQQRPGESFLENLDGKGVKTEVMTMAVLQVDDYAQLLKGNTDKDGEEFIVRMTNGATLTGSQLVERALLEKGVIVAVSREHGPLDVFRTRRFATDKQRLALMAESPCCAWKDCPVPFEKCQIHHMVAWARGGSTDILNLVPLCPYHNGVNDDDPTAPPMRGRMVRVGGRVAWQPPYDAAPIPTSKFN
ncbi:TPA: HNH endonuclease [Corynebacterium striatum]|nr:HNH endonuclease [Corynebacterium striatum]HCD3161001.1 HNH endonuclease [Corynebacterium striatum]HCD3683152.1 HNH endonuclease [Corynebacterium striatum]HCD4755690.1 HNH endonuclease [Corynebacterium striatum]HCD5913782.1 HNH endonuclease [Corynebacterium striatum]